MDEEDRYDVTFHMKEKRWFGGGIHATFGGENNATMVGLSIFCVGFKFSLFVHVLCFLSLLRIFHLKDVTIAGEVMDAQHSWQLSNEGSLAYHTYWDTRQPLFKIV